MAGARRLCGDISCTIFRVFGTCPLVVAQKNKKVNNNIYSTVVIGATRELILITAVLDANCILNCMHYIQLILVMNILCARQYFEIRQHENNSHPMATLYSSIRLQFLFFFSSTTVGQGFNHCHKSSWNVTWKLLQSVSKNIRSGFWPFFLQCFYMFRPGQRIQRLKRKSERLWLRENWLKCLNFVCVWIFWQPFITFVSTFFDDDDKFYFDFHFILKQLKNKNWFYWNIDRKHY